MAPKIRKSTGRKTARKPTALYVANVTFKMRTPPISKTEATKLLAKAKRKGGTGTINKV